MKNIRRLFPYLAKYKTRIALGAVFVFGTNGMALFLPKYSAEAIDSIRMENPPHTLTWYCMVIVGTYVISAILRFFVRQTIVVMSRMVEYDLRRDLWNHVQSLSQDFFSRQSTGDVMARLTNDVEAVRMFPGPALMYSLDSIGRLGFMIGLMLTLSPLLTGLTLLPLPLLALFVYLMSSRVHARFTKVQEQFSAMTSRVQQNFSGIRVIKSYVREENEIKRFETSAWDYRENQMALARVQAFFRPMLMLIPSFSVIIILGVGGWLVNTDNAWVVRTDNNISIGALTAFMICLNRLVWPVMALGWVTNISQRADASMKRLNELFDTKPTIIDNEETDHSITTITGDIEFKAASISYEPGQEKVLDGVDIKIPEGEVFAILGRTGCGKTTFVNMIPRLLEPTEGEVLVGGHPVKKIPLNVLRKAISMAPQEAFLFSDTMANNIRFSNPDADDEAVLHALEVAGLKKDIAEFPEGIQTKVGERGLTLSGGQKQRCALARAILANPKILILDDTLSAVDTATEETILSHLRNIMHEQTTLIISHRISTVQDADQILVLDHGKLAEQGTHEELLKADGIYADINRKQQLETELARIS